MAASSKPENSCALPRLFYSVQRHHAPIVSPRAFERIFIAPANILEFTNVADAMCVFSRRTEPGPGDRPAHRHITHGRMSNFPASLILWGGHSKAFSVFLEFFLSFTLTELRRFAFTTPQSCRRESASARLGCRRVEDTLATRRPRE